jgi:uncharacterized protein YdhG (YjbR/CyaY superfamily)
MISEWMRDPLFSMGLWFNRRGLGVGIMESAKVGSVDEYIASFDGEVRERLEGIRAIIREAAPEAVEKISYGVPAYKMRKILVYFAAHKSHIGLYPTPSAAGAFKEELKPFKSGKGSIIFPNDEPIPYDRIRRIVEFRVREDSEK